jgi:uncharacterized protein (TIGR04255 family)
MSEIFPNAPLKEAVFQLRFAGELSVEVGRAKIQAAVRSDLPKLYVPRAAVGVAPSLQPVEFRSEDEAEMIGLALNSFSYHSKHYPGFATFRQRFGKFWGVFSEHIAVTRLTRAGLRYINHIPALRPSEHAPIPVQDYLNVGFRLPTGIEGDLTSLNMAFVVRLEEGMLRIALEHKRVEAPPSEILVLDFDFAQHEDLRVGDVDEYLNRAHQHTKRIFLELVSERYLAVMRSTQ